MSSIRQSHKHYHADGDIVLLSKDNALFRVHSTILKFASSFFRQMLELPRASGEGADEPIPLEENEEILSAIFDTIYPVENLPSIPTVSFAWDLALSADKYDIPRVHSFVHSTILSKLQNEHNASTQNEEIMEVYVLACRWKWEDMAELAAISIVRYCKVHASSFSAKDLERLSSYDLARLFLFHEKRVESLIEAYREAMGFEDLENNYSDDFWFCCDCGKVSISTQDTIEMLEIVEDGIRGNLDIKQDTSVLLDRWFRELGPLLALLGCSECEQNGYNHAHVRSQMQIAVNGLDSNVPWNSVRTFEKHLS